jgi:hypothetical protein
MCSLTGVDGYSVAGVWSVVPETQATHGIKFGARKVVDSWV